MAPPCRPTSPASNKSKRRKSWFSFRRRAHRSQTDVDRPRPPPSAFQPHRAASDTDNPSDQIAGPLQFQPERIATLYVTPSERDLYLAAMSQLDQAPQPLHLWADPPPRLPRLPVSPAIIPESSLDASTSVHPLYSMPLSPKLVTSPNLPGSGLQIREEFRQTSTLSSTRHALLSLAPNSFLRLTGFDPETVATVNQTIGETWPGGVWQRSEEMDTVVQRPGTGDGFTWKAELHGRAWKRKGSQELDSIRLLLALLTVLGTHGWVVDNTIQAAGPQKLSHNLLFRYSEPVQAVPPAFFALSIPLPDRISLVHTPNKITPSVLTAVRGAICSSLQLSSQAKSSTNATTGTSPSDSIKGLTWGKDGQAKGVKLEGWVHPGVYRFWIAGLRRLGGRLSQSKVDDLHPALILAIMNNLSSIHFELAVSVPLFPSAKGRDVLFFSSSADSGLSHLDSFVSRPSGVDTSEPESPVLISPAETFGPEDSAINGAPATNTIAPAPPPKRHAQLPLDQADVNDDRRVLPWSSILDDSTVTAPPHGHSSSEPGIQGPAPPSVVPDTQQRAASRESVRPLIPPAATASPRKHNVLLKKNSLRRQRSVSGEGATSTPYPASTVTDIARRDTDQVEDEGQWSMVEIPAKVGQLGISTEPGQDAFGSMPARSVMPVSRGDLDQAAIPSRPEGLVSSQQHAQRADVPRPKNDVSVQPATHQRARSSPTVPSGSGSFFTTIAPARPRETYDSSSGPHLDRAAFVVRPEDTPPLISRERGFAPHNSEASHLPHDSPGRQGDTPLTTQIHTGAAQLHHNSAKQSAAGGGVLNLGRHNPADYQHPHGPRAPATHDAVAMASPRSAFSRPTNGAANAAVPVHTTSLGSPRAGAEYHSAPLRDPDVSLKRTEHALVDVGQGIGIPSMHGSLGFCPRGQSIVSDGQSDVSLPPPVPAPRVGSSRTQMTIE